MDMTDIEKEIANLKLPSTAPAKRVDMTVKYARVKVIVSKALGGLFFATVALFAWYVVTNANIVEIDNKVVMILGFVFMVLGAYVALKLWHIEFIGWLALFYISLAGIALPALSAYSRGMAPGTIPIMAVSFVALVVLWLIRDLYRVKKVRDIFRMPG